MKKLIRDIGAVAFMTVFLTCLAVHAETVETKLTVDESVILKSSTKDMLGINGNWYSEQLFLGGNTSTEISKEYIEAVNGLNIPIVLSRMSGADSQYFSWKESLGTLEERSGGNLGMVEWIKAHTMVNPDVKFTFTLNIIEDSLDDHKDLVRFLTLMPSDPQAVGSDGVNWAQKRVDLGIAEPVNIKTFELGNEVYYDYVDGCLDNIQVNIDDVSAGVAAYVEDCIEIIDAMESVNPDISFTTSSFTYTKKVGEDAKVWNEYLVNNLAGKIDYVAYHEYYYNYNFYWYTMQLNQYLYQYINKLDAAVRPKIYHSEYGYWMSGYNLEELKNGTSVYGTLINAKFLNNIINMPLIEMASIHVTHERISTESFWRTGWDLFRIYDDGKIYCTAPTEMLKIFDKALGNGSEKENVVSAELSGNEYVGGYGNFSDTENTPVDALTVSAHTTSENGINIVFVNGSEDITHNVTFEFNGEYRLLEKYVLSSENMSDNNLKGSDDTVYMKSYAVNSAQKLEKHTVEPASIVVLKCVPIGNTEIAREHKIKFYNSLAGEDNIPTVGNSFAFTCEFAQDSTLAAAGDVYCVVPKNGVTAEEFFAGGSNVNDLCWFDSVNVRRNIAYCDIALPENMVSGKYTAIVGLLEEGKYITVEFYLDNNQYEKNIQIGEVTQNGKLSADIQFENGFEPGEECSVVVQKNSYIAHIDIISVPESGIVSYFFDMPDDATGGKYDFKVLCGSAEFSRKFTFDRAEDFVEFSSELTNENGDVVRLSNIGQSESINFKINNKTDKKLDAHLFACVFDAGGKLVSVCSEAERVIESGQEDVEISLPVTLTEQNSDIDLVKVFIWGREDIQPYIGTYYIK